MKNQNTITRTGNLKDMSKLAKQWSVTVTFSHHVSSTLPNGRISERDVYMVALPAAEAQQAFWGNLVNSYNADNYAE